ncbi:hypothetical protein ACFPJ4_11290 [Lysinimonas soli]|uniref:DUF4190 domain-containing protein n=1 Tax=Lysinimonas soli TaxID=1074233 RepID=A0ABW0NVD8_9MICO
MTDATPTPPTPEQPAAAPAPAPAYAAAPAAAAPKQTLSLLSFIFGIASVVFSAAPLLPLAAGIAAIILGVKARKSEPGAPKWMATVGIITGIVGIVLSIILGLVIYILPLIFLASYGGVVSNY